MNTYRRIAALIGAVIVSILLPIAVFASEEDGIADELERQLGEIDVSSWDEYFDDIGRITDEEFSGMDDMLLRFAERGSGSSSSGLFDILISLIKQEVGRSLGAVAALAAAALVSALACFVSDEGVKRVLSVILGLTAVTTVLSMLLSLTGTAVKAIDETCDFAEKTTPVMSALMISAGASASLGIFRPLFLFLSGTVAKIVNGIVMPIVVAHGALTAADAFMGDAGLEGFIKLSKKAVKWILGALSVFYFGVTAVQGLTAAARDGVAIRTAKYALDKLVPIVGSMVSGTADSVMGCALLLKNGVGTAAVLILLSIIARPALIEFSGMLIFRLAAAICTPVAEGRAARLFSNAADTASQLLACTAVTGSMLAVTVLVIMASGGIAAGLW